jgi:hypothetical protein
MDLAPGDILSRVRALLQTIESLREYDIQTLADYAEFLFAKALRGERHRRGHKGCDVTCDAYGRVQVKHRLLPRDGRIEERLHCRNLDPLAFDTLGAVIFNTDATVKKALVVRQADMWTVYQSTADPDKKISYAKFAALPAATDMTAALRQVLGPGDSDGGTREGP